VSRRAGKIGIGLAGLGGVGLLGTSWWLGGRLTAPAHAEIGPPPADFPAEVIEIPIPRSAPVHGWWRGGEPGAGVVVLLHALRDDRRAMLRRARLLAEAGVGTLLVDLRGHGETVGRRISFGLAEAVDAHAAVAFARARAAGERLGAIGFSLGGASALLGSSPIDVDALVLEAVYPSLVEAIEARIAMRLGRGLAKLLTPLLVAQVRPRLGAPLAALRPIDGIRRLRGPVLVAAGTRDPKTPLHQSRRLFAAAPEPKELWEVEGAAHEDFLDAEPEGYRRRVLDGFLRPRLRRG